MTALQELEELQKDVCRIYMHDYSCTADCPFNKDGCMIDREIYREITRQKNKEHSA